MRNKGSVYDRRGGGEGVVVEGGGLGGVGWWVTLHSHNTFLMQMPGGTAGCLLVPC